MAHGSPALEIEKEGGSGGLPSVPGVFTGASAREVIEFADVEAGRLKPL